MAVQLDLTYKVLRVLAEGFQWRLLKHE